MRIRTENLKFSYGKKEILKGVSLEGKEGCFTGLLGANGSGKSTLLKCIYRVLRPASGKIFFDDTCLEEISIQEGAKRLSVTTQFGQVVFQFKVIDIVLMGRTPYKGNFERETEEDYKIARRCLASVGLSHLEERDYNSLSGGEKQRVMLARALTQEAEAMILDEPTNHLDIKYQLEIMSLVKSLGKTTMAAIHDLNIAAMYCDYIYALKDGKIACEGSPRQVLTKENIKMLYGVSANIIELEDGTIRVIF